MKRKAIVCDIDGCILQTDFILQEIHELGLKGDAKWEYFYEHCNSDRVKVIHAMKMFYRYIHDCMKIDFENVACIISTARVDKYPCNRETKAKLAQEGILFEKMYMRKQNDFRPACEVKKDHLIQIMKEFDIVAFIDDNLANCEMAKSLGVLALRRV